MSEMIDIHFDFRTEIGKNKDPDLFSKTLKKYHKILWSKRLPGGQEFKLEDGVPKVYLYHRSTLGEFKLSSDAITHSYKNTKRMAHIIQSLPPDIYESIFNKGCTIGSYIIFPKNKEKNQHSINQSRGFNPKIVDRFDLTLECIRLFYQGQKNPLSEVLSRHADFFHLFVDFKGYVDFFLLQDLVSSDYSKVKFHLPNQHFENKPLPQSVDEYLEYRENTLNFIQARAERMLKSLTDSLYYNQI